jgi:formamidopyrimidine-DNA glycosylase
MPELPEVETVVRALREPLAGRTITDLRYDWARTYAEPDAPQFADRIRGQQVQRVGRRGKYILVALKPDTLIVHLRMTGRLYVVPDDADDYADQWLRGIFQLDNAHQLRFSDSRKFGRCWLVDDPQRVVGKLGPEPLDDTFTLDVFHELMTGRRGRLKPLLLDQHVIAGIGNIYADEALFRARLHPLRPADTLDAGDRARLHEAIRHVLRDGIAREGASVNWYRKPDGTKGSAQHGLQVYNQQGRPCPRCGHPVEKLVVGQRGTHICPVCQTR